MTTEERESIRKEKLAILMVLTDSLCAMLMLDRKKYEDVAYMAESLRMLIGSIRNEH